MNDKTQTLCVVQAGRCVGQDNQRHTEGAQIWLSAADVASLTASGDVVQALFVGTDLTDLQAAANAEAQRLADEQAAAAEAQRLADEQAAAAAAEAQRLADEQAAAAAAEAQRLADEQAAAAAAEAQRLADEQAAAAAAGQTDATKAKNKAAKA